MIISLNPTYYCNFRCPFCYLTPEQLGDKKKASIQQIQERLQEVIDAGETIDCIDLYGGEITELPDDYVYKVLQLCRKYSDRINIVTNLSKLKKYLWNRKYNIYVSYDHRARERWEEVFQNMHKLTRPFNILMLTSVGILRNNVQEIIDHCNALKHLESVEIKPYSANQANKRKVRHTDHENFIKRFLTAERPLNCTFHNEDLIVDSLNGTNNAFSDDHIYITPSGKFGVLEFDDDDREYFLELDNFDDYIAWAEKEKVDTYLNGYCAACPYLGSCLSEHLREVKDISESCNGYKLLLDWYDENKEWKKYVK